MVIEIETEPGVCQTYLLKEMIGPEIAAFRKWADARTKYDDKGNAVGVKQFDGLQSKLISMCLYDPDGTPVPLAVVDGFPVSTQEILFQACQRLNAMTDRGRDEAKKD